MEPAYAGDEWRRAGTTIIVRMLRDPKVSAKNPNAMEGLGRVVASPSITNLNCQMLLKVQTPEIFSKAGANENTCISSGCWFMRFRNGGSSSTKKIKDKC